MSEWLGEISDPLLLVIELQFDVQKTMFYGIVSLICRASRTDDLNYF